MADSFPGTWVATPNGCWEWAGAKSLGYGQLRWRGRAAWAHRVAYSVFVGEIPAGYQIDHLCRNRACVNPEHLEAVTQRTNLERQAAATGCWSAEHGRMMARRRWDVRAEIQ